MSTSHEERDALLESIAVLVLGVPTLKTRGSDSLDFHDLGVETLRRALVSAFEAGRELNAELLLRDIPKPPRRAEGGAR